ncbi:MAG: MBL fold metallo-hydrolase [Cyanobacteria bacterium P01_H01_bin.15]
MQRRRLLGYLGAGALSYGSVMLSGLTKPAVGQGSGVSIRYFGHTCFLFRGDGIRILVNPFEPLGCTVGYRRPQPTVDLVLVSSTLLDEGAAGDLPGDPKILFESGVYQVNNRRIQGINTERNTDAGRRFAPNVIWRWKQGGVKIVHMGGALAPIEFEQKILIGTPDILLLPVGGGAKAYAPEQAKAVVDVLNPKIVIPTQYRTAAADEDNCDIVGLDEFLTLMKGSSVSRLNSDTLNISSGGVPGSGPQIRILSAASSLA